MALGLHTQVTRDRLPRELPPRPRLLGTHGPRDSLSHSWSYSASRTGSCHRSKEQGKGNPREYHGSLVPMTGLQGDPWATYNTSLSQGPAKRLTRKRCLVHIPSSLSLSPNTQDARTRAHGHSGTHTHTNVNAHQYIYSPPLACSVWGTALAESQVLKSEQSRV